MSIGIYIHDTTSVTVRRITAAGSAWLKFTFRHGDDETSEFSVFYDATGKPLEVTGDVNAPVVEEIELHDVAAETALRG